MCNGWPLPERKFLVIGKNETVTVEGGTSALVTWPLYEMTTRVTTRGAEV